MNKLWQEWHYHATEHGCQMCRFNLEAELGPVQGPMPAPARMPRIERHKMDEWAGGWL